MPSTLHVGVDENGLGPRLGPLVVTAVSARATESGAKVLGKRPRGGLAGRLGDSKDLVSFGDSGLGAAWALALAKRSGGRSLSRPEDVIRALALDPDSTLRKACPPHHVDQCWGAQGEALAADSASPLVGMLAQVEEDLARLDAKGLTVIRAQVAIVCAKRLNEAIDRGISRFDVDLHTMERLVTSASRSAKEEVVATCGKVGGYNRYGDAFASFPLHVAIVEGRARSEYRVPGIGMVSFVRDAEARDLLVAMASLVGKWVRDLMMRRIIRYHRDSVPDLPDASGYHDPVTTRFIAATALTRRKFKIDDECFVRRALEPAAGE
jgi:ribonuclease HII